MTHVCHLDAHSINITTFMKLKKKLFSTEMEFWRRPARTTKILK